MSSTSRRRAGPGAQWLPLLADTIGARRPRRIPRWLARLVTGDAGIVLLTWRRGFVASYGSA